MRNPRFRVFFSIISTIVFCTLLYEKFSIRSSIVHGASLKNRRIMHEIHGISSINVTTFNITDGKLLGLQICSEFIDHKGYASSCDFLIANPNCNSDLLPGDLIHDIGVAHVDHNYFEPLQEQLQNMPMPFPVLKINSQKKSIDSFISVDFNIIGYHPHEQIEMKMAV